ncbi:metallophosphoesterase (TIGR00282 family) [Scopulibacillus daqui]|uniref:Metallophosphoesterase (TIGR00282 family) n=1 Tax=Scopulibacillus daqui TaxID=1469162 RepID=A0ABS2PWK2_9BACL|nr:TIGR00282 family metallophosphoesterase [Scopulibacillus daqui]MBM7644416.1 metallophosphoesterase (TIGR00282 family) [Scopulibacillus daqui]
MRILFVGDVYGKLGRTMIKEYLQKLKACYKPTFTIVNGENAAHGKGITEKIYREMMDSGADMITMGNHTWDNRDIFEFIDNVNRIVRPANFPEGTPGVGMQYLKINQLEMAVINLQGRTFLPALDDPFRTADHLIEEARKRTPMIFVDIHAETTSEKMALAWYLDGRVSAVVGTHTHVQTADERILPKGTAYLTDVGMTGPYDGIIGVEREAVIKKFLTNLPVRFESEKGRGQLSSVIIDIDEQTGKATHIQRRLINDDHPFYD